MYTILGKRSTFPNIFKAQNKYIYALLRFYILYGHIMCIKEISLLKMMQCSTKNILTGAALLALI